MAPFILLPQDLSLIYIFVCFALQVHYHNTAWCVFAVFLDLLLALRHPQVVFVLLTLITIDQERADIWSEAVGDISAPSPNHEQQSNSTFL